MAIGPAGVNPRMSTTTPPDTSPTQRPWGWFQTVAEAPGFKIKRIGVWPGQQISLQKHRHRAEHWVVVTGTAHVTLDAREFDLALGASCDIALGQVHRLANHTAGPLEIVEIQFGSVLSEDDIIRLSDDYGRH